MYALTFVADGSKLVKVLAFKAALFRYSKATRLVCQVALQVAFCLGPDSKRCTLQLEYLNTSKSTLQAVELLRFAWAKGTAAHAAWWSSSSWQKGL